MNNNSEDIKSSIDVVESLMSKRDYDSAITQWIKIKNNFNLSSLNIDFRLFDAFLRINDFEYAERIIESAKSSSVLKNKVCYTKYTERRQILNSSKAKRYNLLFIILDSCKNVGINLFSLININNAKASDLTSYKLVFSANRRAFCDEFIIESYDNIYRNSTKKISISVEPTFENDSTIRYVLPVNLLNVKKNWNSK